MGEVIGLVSLKGGVGKTTLAAALASELANRHGKDVLLIDANYSAPNLGIHMDIISPGKTIHDVLAGDRISGAVHFKHEVDVVPGNFLFDKDYNPLKLRNKLAYAKKKYDFIVLDASPNMGEETLSTVLAADKLFMVTTPDYPSLSCLMKLALFAKKRQKEVSGIIMNRVIGKNFQVSLEEIQESTGIPVVAKVMEDKWVQRALFARTPANFTRGSFAKEIKKLGASLVGKPTKRALWKKALFIDMDKEEVNREVLRNKFYTSMFKG